MYIANVENSEIDVSGIRTVLVQGDSSYPVIRFILDPSLTGLNWRVRGTYTDSNIPVLSPEIVPVESATEITLDWSVSADFTTYYGNMQLVVVGANDSGTVITKALGEVTIRRDYSIGTMAEITLNLFEQLLAQVSAQVPAHNNLSGIQGGTETERYHLTAAEHTVVGNTSGVNTGDQDVSGAISTHNASATAHANQIAPLVTNHNWLYDGRDLSAIFTAAQFIAAVRANDWSNIRIGDYWPITLTGTFRDYGYYTCPVSTNYYSDTGLITLVGQTTTSYRATYVSATYCSISISSTTYYVSTAACTAYYERSLSNAVVKMEVAGISPYSDFGDTVLTAPHVALIGRDCLPFSTRMRLADTVWTDGGATNPWKGSALYKTLNEPTYGILPIVAATDIGAYIYTGASSLGMRIPIESKASGATTSTSATWDSRGQLFVPKEGEVTYSTAFAENYATIGLTFMPLFANSTKHRVKRLGNGSSITYYWTMSSGRASATNFVIVEPSGSSYAFSAAGAFAVPLCFIVA